jgi:signal peptidase I
MSSIGDYFARRQQQKMLRQQHAPKKSIGREYVEAFGIAILFALIIRFFVIQAFKIPSGSMEDTLLIGDFLLANKFIYGTEVPLLGMRVPGLREPRPNDILIFKCPDDPEKDYIKRCVAVAGQTVYIRNKELFVDNLPQTMPPRGKHIDSRMVPGAYDPRDNFGPVVVPQDSYFCMGDNRDNSRDSRYWGFLPKKNLKGKALIIYWSWNNDPDVPLFNLVHKVRWKRIGRLIK